MKRLSIVFLSLLLTLSILLVACAGDNAPVGTDTLTDTAADSDSAAVSDTAADTTDTAVPDTQAPDTNTESSTQTENKPANTPVTVTERYIPTEVFSRLRVLFENRLASFSTYSSGNAPYVMNDVYTISDCRLLSIQIPVMQTGSTDSEGNFRFTISVFDNSYAGLRASAKRSYTLKINAQVYGLSANASNIQRFIKVPLESYNISLTERETIGFFSSSDTIFPAYLGEDRTQANAAHNLLKSEFPQATSFFGKAGSTDILKQYNTLIYDFEWERTYENQAEMDALQAEEAAYRAKVDALRKDYEGKSISILGDSISTYSGISNSTAFNSTIGNNAIYYSNSATNKCPALFDYSQTYWGRLVTDLDLRLCVNNSWSGSRVIGGSKTMLDRCIELDNDNGTPSNPADDVSPDIILIYMGINDLHKGSSLGSLYDALQEGSNPYATVEDWFESVTGATDFCSTYALSLKAMAQKYPNAEIFCMTLIQSRDTAATAAKIEAFNTCIMAMANYFGATIINQQTNGYLSYQNCHGYGADITALHPNAEGHRLMERLIVETLYRKRITK